MSLRLRAAILAAADALEASRDELCRLDAVAGDGDHGVTMTLAARAARGVVVASPESLDPADLIAKVATSLASVGGAIGPIWATGLLRVAAVVRGVAPGSPMSVGDLRACAEAAEGAIAALGGAKPGDKTILDAIDPLVDALAVAGAEGADVAGALASAARAARSGAESTAGMIASVGRASRLGERGRGSPDPGASSFAIVVDALVASWSGATGAGVVPE